MFRPLLSVIKKRPFSECRALTIFDAASCQTTSFCEMPFPPPELLVDISGGEVDADDAWEESLLDSDVECSLVDLKGCYNSFSETSALSRFLSFQVLDCQLQSQMCDQKNGTLVKWKNGSKTRPYSAVPREREKMPYIYKCSCANREIGVSRSKHLQICKGLALRCQQCKERLFYDRKIKQIVSRSSALTRGNMATLRTCSLPRIHAVKTHV